MGENGQILLHVSEENLRWNRMALDYSERERLAESLATRIGEHIIHDFDGWVYKMRGSVALVLLHRVPYGPNPVAFVRSRLLIGTGIEQGDRFFCQVTTRGIRSMNMISAGREKIPMLSSEDIFNLRKL